MTNSFFYLFSLVISIHQVSYAQKETTFSTVRSEISEVTVYLSGAECRNKAIVNIKKGRNILTFEGLSGFLQEKSVQINNTGAIEIVSIVSKKDKLNINNSSLRLKHLNDSIISLSNEIELLKNQVDAFQFEKSMLSKNQELGKNSNVTITDLSKAANFFRERTLSINNSISAINNKIKAQQFHLEQAQSEFDSTKARTNLIRKNITIVLNSTIDQNVDFNIRYLVSNAAWSSTYDLIATDINKPITLKYKGQIYNNTGIDWKDVKLTLSTGNPSVNASHPTLTSWNLNYDSNGNEGLLDYKNYNKEIIRTDSSIVYEEVNTSELNNSFEILNPYTIVSNIQPYTIEISSASLPAIFEYLTIPKVDLSAFLLAKVTGWEKLNLMDGMANIYFGNTYLGESRIDTRLIGDTLELSLGRDNQVFVSRSKLEDASSTKLIGLKKTESFKYEIQIKNNRPSSITIKIQDQVPISQESDITVDVEEISGASLDPLSGRILWVDKITPGEKIKHSMAFSVKYPKNKRLLIRKDRVVRTPRFRS